MPSVHSQVCFREFILTVGQVVAKHQVSSVSALSLPGADFTKGLRLSLSQGLKSKTLVLARSGT